MMKVSAKAEYACLALLALAQHGQTTSPLRIREIAESHGIPARYLVQILLQLKGAGLVSSIRGASGGYRLARPPDQIALSEVLTAIEGPDTLQRDPVLETLPAARALAGVWNRVRAAERGVLDRTTLAELIAEASPHEWTI